MGKYCRTVLFMLLCLSFLDVFAQKTIDANAVIDQKESLWKGFTRYDFKHKERDARLILPKEPLPGNPWVWRARFPDYHSEADSILISEGYHLVYINTDNMYGSPNAIKVWDDFYDFLTDEVKLQKTVSLMGVSRGGLFIYNWAKVNPEIVACIYAEVPVCDFKSWPAGFGASEGNIGDWEKLKAEYGFDSDEEAKLYADNPIDNLDALAKAKVPILHMIGLKDEVVPYDENTMPLISTYIALGGNASVITSAEGAQKSKGHHIPIETPRAVADFIRYHSLSH